MDVARLGASQVVSPENNAVDVVNWFLTGPFLYAALLVFGVGSIYQLVRLARMPHHLRWELYPIPHLGQEGSKYQQLDFAQLHRGRHRLAEVAYMAQEILLLKKVFLHHRKLWLGSFLLHAGLYSCLVFGAMIAVGAVTESPLAGFLHPLTVVMGAAGLAAGLTGVVLLTYRRLRDPDLHDMSDRVTFLNLALLAALFGSGLLTWLTVDPTFEQLRIHVHSLLRGRPAGMTSAWLTLPLFLGGTFLMYLPFSRMFHFAAKYFTYHRVLWNDASVKRGSPMEKELAEQLNYPVSWSAEHVQQQASWLDQVASDESEGGPDDK